MLRATLDSIESAKAHQQQERRQVERETDIRFVGDDFVTPQPAGEWVVVQCPHCAHVSVGETTGRAVKSITQHLVRRHHARKEQQ